MGCSMSIGCVLALGWATQASPFVTSRMIAPAFAKSEGCTPGAFAPGRFAISIASLSPYALVSEWPGTWVVACTAAHLTVRAKNNIEAAEVPCYVPMVRQTRVYKGKRQNYSVALFGGYIFACLYDPGDVHKVRWAHDVSDVLNVVDQPKFVREIAGIQQAIAVNPHLDLFPELLEGRKARVRSGPYQNLEGVIVTRNARDRFFLQVEMMGSSVSLEIDGALLEAA
jgi:transcription antitermination factor NusG